MGPKPEAPSLGSAHRKQKAQGDEANACDVFEICCRGVRISRRGRVLSRHWPWYCRRERVGCAALIVVIFALPLRLDHG